jgi:DNA-binding GntR family transcriptional regulator
VKQVDRPPTLVAAAADNIRHDILCGDLLPGQSLPEVELSKTLNISRGSVREALRLLQQEGLVEIIPYRGAFVACLSPGRVEEIYTLRCLLEPYAVRLSIENQAYTETDFQQMKMLVARLGELERSTDYLDAIETDMYFHDVICRRCNHGLLLDMLKNLQSLTVMFILNTKLYRSDMVPDDVSHQALCDGIRSGDAALAAEMVRKHISDAGSSLVRRMQEAERIAESLPG